MSCSTSVWSGDPCGGNILSFVAMFTMLCYMYDHWSSGIVKASLASLWNLSELAIDTT
jgi:hypothetical protein